MEFEPSDSDDEPLDVILKNAQVAEQSYIQWTSNNAACALGKSHHAEMQLNHGIARNKKRQLEQNVQLYKKKRQNSMNSSSEGETIADLLSGKRNGKKRRKRVKAKDLKSETGNQSESDGDVTVRKTAIQENVNNRRMKNTKRGRDKKPTEVQTPNQVEPQATEKQNDRELRTHEQLLKNRSKQREIAEENKQLKSEQSHIDEQLKILREKWGQNERRISENEKSLDVLDKLNDKIIATRFNTPPSKTSQHPNRKSVVCISSDEDHNAPIWERNWYKKK